MTTARTVTGRPCLVTQETCRLTPRVSSDSRRAVWKPGRTFTPRPVMILKPRLSAVSARSTRTPSPEMISASFGSATLYSNRRKPKITNSRTMSPPAAYSRISKRLMAPTPSLFFCCACVGAPSTPSAAQGLPPLDVKRPRGFEVDQEPLGAGGEGLVRVGRVGVERLRAAPDVQQYLADEAGADRAGHTASAADHPPKPFSLTLLPFCPNVPGCGSCSKTKSTPPPPRPRPPSRSAFSPACSRIFCASPN